MNLAQNIVHVGTGDIRPCGSVQEIQPLTDISCNQGGCLRHLTGKLYVDGLLSDQEVGGTENGFVRLVVCIEFIQVVWYLTTGCSWKLRGSYWKNT